MSLSVQIGDSFKEYFYSDRRETSILDYKIGVVKSIKTKLDKEFVIISFDKKGQLKITTEIETSNLEKVDGFLIRKY